MDNPVQPLPEDTFKETVAKSDKESYIHKDLVALDQMINVLADGNPDETISSRMARWATEETGLKQQIGIETCKALNIAQKDHGAIAEANDLGRADGVAKIEEDSPTVKAEEQ